MYAMTLQTLVCHHYFQLLYHIRIGVFSQLSSQKLFNNISKGGLPNLLQKYKIKPTRGKKYQIHHEGTEQNYSPFDTNFTKKATRILYILHEPSFRERVFSNFTKHPSRRNLKLFLYSHASTEISFLNELFFVKQKNSCGVGERA